MNDNSFLGKLLNIEDVFGNDYVKLFHIELKEGNSYAKTLFPNVSTRKANRYYVYLHKLTYRLERDTNIIVDRDTKKRITTKKDFASNLCISTSTLRKFLSVCIENNLIATYLHKGHTLYVLSPEYALYGDSMPKVFVELFPKARNWFSPAS